MKPQETKLTEDLTKDAKEAVKAIVSPITKEKRMRTMGLSPNSKRIVRLSSVIFGAALAAAKKLPYRISNQRTNFMALEACKKRFPDQECQIVERDGVTLLIRQGNTINIAAYIFDQANGTTDFADLKYEEIEGALNGIQKSKPRKVLGLTS